MNAEHRKHLIDRLHVVDGSAAPAMSMRILRDVLIEMLDDEGKREDAANQSLRAHQQSTSHSSPVTANTASFWPNNN